MLTRSNKNEAVLVQDKQADLGTQKTTLAEQQQSSASKPIDLISKCLDHKIVGDQSIKNADELARLLFKNKKFQKQINWTYKYFENNQNEIYVVRQTSQDDIATFKENEEGLLMAINAKELQKDFRLVDENRVTTFEYGSMYLVAEEDSRGIHRIQGNLPELKQYRCEI